MFFEIINEVEEEHNGGWIPTSERQPDKEGKYLITDYGYVTEAFYRNGCWFDTIEHYIYRSVTAWQPFQNPIRRYK